MLELALGDDGKPRCSWGHSPPEYMRYHDTEWGFPVDDDNRLFEKICLEGFQSGLSWLTVLRKREDFRRSFHHFEVARVVEMDEEDVERLLADASIIRHRGKIEATINNAARVLELREDHPSLASFVWRYRPEHDDPARSVSPESEAMSNDLKKRGFRFVGPTTMYAFMQSMGLVNDHLDGCVIRPEVEAALRKFEIPG